MKSHIVFILLCIPAFSFGYSEGKVGFTVDIKGEINPYKIFSVFLLPEQKTNVKSETPISVVSETITCIRSNDKEWLIQAPPKPGTYEIRIMSQEEETMQINVLVLTPISEKKGEYLNGYRIGNYPITPLKGNPIYNRPSGFFEVTEENVDMLLTPHFSLRQFLCKQSADFPKYVLIRERLLLKLEYVLTRVNQHHYAIETFGFISGYRTPYYNKEIKNVAYSRHVYGGAADIFIDQNHDGHMDDLNGDGTVDDKDVGVFYNIVESEFTRVEYNRFKGGLGFYRKNSAHSGFIHVDVRGWKARW